MTSLASPQGSCPPTTYTTELNTTSLATHPPDLVAMDVAGRADRVRAGGATAGCDALLITNPISVGYLTGFTGSSGMVWLGPEELLLVTDRRYAEQAEAETSRAGVPARIEITNDPPRDILAAAAGGVGRIGLEATSVSWAHQRRYAEWFGAAELVATTGVVEHCRRIKDAGEIDRIARAAAIADAALAEVRPLLAGGPTEKEVALALDTALRRRGASGSAFTTIVASGPNAALPHLRPTDRAIGRGELVIVDMGAVVDGYRSDMTRTLAVEAPDATACRVFETVRDAQRLGVEQVVPGRAVLEVDRACRNRIDAEGWADAFVHGTGHGVGLEIHEQPWIRSTAAEPLQTGQVITVEPGIYLTGLCGARVEDTVVVTADGARPLTNSPKTLEAV
ncbi:M24 family metallopeptidase [Candidatus Poriferisocius sp.]|uniref:M24 family metallopeptidase n=1 Tax=Candidatus Poriferisocius sp. TaxID=3101276 RepID=UPI003B0281B2